MRWQAQGWVAVFVLLLVMGVCALLGGRNDSLRLLLSPGAVQDRGPGPHYEAYPHTTPTAHAAYSQRNSTQLGDDAPTSEAAHPPLLSCPTPATAPFHLRNFGCTCTRRPVACSCWHAGRRVHPRPRQTLEEYCRDVGTASHEAPGAVLATWHAFRDLADVKCTCFTNPRNGRVVGMSPSCRGPPQGHPRNRTIFYWDPVCLHLLPARLEHHPYHFVLITHQRDAPVCDPDSTVCLRLLRHPRLLAWYGINALTRDVGRLFPIPLSAHVSHVERLAAFRREGGLARGRPAKLALMQFTWKRGHCGGKTFHKRECQRARVVDTLNRSGIPPVPLDEGLLVHWRRMMQHRFVISPPGNGLDSYRTWEALYLGRVPVVRSGPFDDLYAELPVVATKDWAEVCPTFLEERWREMQRTKFSLEKLWIYYWVEHLLRLCDV